MCYTKTKLEQSFGGHIQRNKTHAFFYFLKLQVSKIDFPMVGIFYHKK
jgi:hypothetical protein